MATECPFRFHARGSLRSNQRCWYAHGGRKMPTSAFAVTQQVDNTDGTIQRELKRQIGDRNFQHWFHDKTAFHTSNDVLIVAVSNPFIQSWIQKHFRDALAAVAHLVLGPSSRVRLEVDSRIASEPRDPNASSTKEPESTCTASRSKTANLSRLERASGRETAGASRAVHRPQRIHRTRRFADLTDFVEGPCNVLALTAVRQVCDAPGSHLNPLFIHGGVGTGKTHLLEGAYRMIRRAFPSLHVMFLTSEAFANYFTQALGEHTLPSFRQRFRNVDILLVDDVDFFDGKRVIQEEFLHTVQQLESQRCQLVLTSDRHPRLLTRLSEELTSRFLSGMVCRLEPPGQETRKQIVRHKADKMDADLSADALDYIAERFRNNVRELEGALNCLGTHHLMTGQRVGLAMARNVLSDLERDCVRIVRLADVEKVVCDLFGVGKDDLKSAKRNRTISQPRMLAMFLARRYTQAAYREIGQYFGGRNHSTVLCAEKKVQSLLSGDATMQVAAQTWRLSEVLDTLEQRLVAG